MPGVTQLPTMTPPIKGPITIGPLGMPIPLGSTASSGAGGQSASSTQGGGTTTPNPLPGLLGGLLPAGLSGTAYDAILLGLLGSGVYGNLQAGQTYGSYEDLLNKIYGSYAGAYPTQLGLGTQTAQQYADIFPQQNQRIINENTLFNNYTALGQNPALVSSGINTLTGGLSKDLVDYITNQVQGQVASRGLGQSGPVFEQALAQALAPYQLQEQQMGQDAYFKALGLPLSVPDLQPYSPLNNPALPAGPSAPGVTDLSSLLQVLGQRAMQPGQLAQALAGNPALAGAAGGTNISNINQAQGGAGGTATGGAGGQGGAGGGGTPNFPGGPIALPPSSTPRGPQSTQPTITYPGQPPITYPPVITNPGQPGTNWPNPGSTTGINYPWPPSGPGDTSTMDLYYWLIQNGYDPNTGLINGQPPSSGQLPNMPGGGIDWNAIFGNTQIPLPPGGGGGGGGGGGDDWFNEYPDFGMEY